MSNLNARMIGCQVLLAGALLLGGVARAADPAPATQKDPSPEVRRQMAAAHRKMADCLESKRSFDDCRTDMFNACHDLMGEGGCPMMGPMGPGMHGYGRMHGGPPQPQTKPDK